jgi:hypothetical protein
LVACAPATRSSPIFLSRGAQASGWRDHDDGQIQVNPYENVIAGRREQAFPVLSEADISRVERFGERRQYHRGERLFAVGERTPGHVLGAERRVDDDFPTIESQFRVIPSTERVRSCLSR